MGRDPFAGRPHNAAEHFRLCFYSAVLLLSEIVPDSTDLLSPYLEELRPTSLGNEQPRAARIAWQRQLAAWESASPVPLPLLALRSAAGLDPLGLSLWFVCGLSDEDTRIGRPTAAVLGGCWDDPDERVRARRGVARLHATGLVHVAQVDGALHPDPVAWDVARGETPAGYQPPDALPDLTRLVLPDAVRRRARSIAALTTQGGCRYIAVRGGETSGRRTLLRAICRELGRGALELSDPWQPAVGAVAAMLKAVPLVSLEPAPGESAPVPVLPAHDGPIALRLPPHGVVHGAENVATVTLSVPGVADRMLHWAQALDGHAPADLHHLAQAHRMTGGAIRRLAKVAIAEAATADRRHVSAADVTAAARLVWADPVGVLATRVPVAGSWSDLVVSEATRDELLLLERRCRQRERLAEALTPAFGRAGAGVRALFTGPSGTGKTLAAGLLAAELDKDLYRLDVSAVVNKYLGETEKNLDRVLERAEALDVVLLIDEGDALLAQRTDVRTANDRYANLETNFLLQRLEVFEGIVVITTNAQQHVDRAFTRRLDVVVDFATPGPAERAALWELHLPADHNVRTDFRQEVSARCALTGGQIRNAVLHATMLAIDRDEPVGTADVDAAVRREYRKTGSICPLRTVVG